MNQRIVIAIISLIIVILILLYIWYYVLKFDIDKGSGEGLGSAMAGVGIGIVKTFGGEIGGAVKGVVDHTQKCPNTYPSKKIDGTSYQKSFEHVFNNECWSCPTDYPSRTIYDIGKDRACERSCPSGYSRHGVSDKCYKCPSGTKRTIFDVDGDKACEVQNCQEKYGTYQNNYKFKHDAGSAVCYACPTIDGKTYKRSWDPVKSDSACVTGNIFKPDKRRAKTYSVWNKATVIPKFIAAKFRGTV